MDAQGLPQRSESTPRLRKMVAGAAALRRKCALERTLFYTAGPAILILAFPGILLYYDTRIKKE